MALGDLSALYESNGNPATVSTGAGDLGGISYGCYQLASEAGSVDAFLGWGLRQGGFYTDYARALQSSGSINSDVFINKWKEIGNIDPQGFKSMQHDYIKHAYYDVAVELLKNNMFHVEKHSDTLKDVIWSRAVQYGPDEIVNLFNEAIEFVPNYTTDWNLSWVDHIRFDYDIIAGIYTANATDVWINPNLAPDVYEGVYDRMRNEMREALCMLTTELKERGLL